MRKEDKDREGDSIRTMTLLHRSIQSTFGAIAVTQACNLLFLASKLAVSMYSFQRWRSRLE